MKDHFPFNRDSIYPEAAMNILQNKNRTIDNFAEVHAKLGGALERMAEKENEEQEGVVGFL